MENIKSFEEFTEGDKAFEQRLDTGKLPDDYIEMYSQTVNDLKDVEMDLEKLIDIIEKSEDHGLRQRTELLYKCKNGIVKLAGELTKENG